METKRLLITGIPGTGKTTVGEYLTKFGYAHFDVEDIILKSKDATLDVGPILRRKDNIVLTWGFPPKISTDSVIDVKRYGLKLIWFDGNREQARKRFVQRESRKSDPRQRTPEALFDLQIHNIEKYDVIRRIEPIQYNTFDADGNFKELKQIKEDLESL